MENRHLDLSVFSNSLQKMVAKNDQLLDYWGRKTKKVKEYSPEEIERIINSGDLDSICSLSRNYFAKDGFYRRLLIYYATILMYYGILIPNSISGKLSPKKYRNALNYLDKMDLQNLLTDISLKVLVDGCYYGIVFATKDGFSILRMPTNHCRTRYVDLQGNDIVEFNVSYFSTIYDDDTREQTLKVYPKEVVAHYRKWIKGKVSSPWVVITAAGVVCFYLTDDCRPMFLNVIPATIDYDDAVDTEQERALEEIRKIIVQKIPHLNDGQLLFEPDEAEEMHTGAVNMMKGNKNLSVLTTYADVEAVVSKTSADTVSNSLEKMVQNIYAQAGTSSLLFATTGTQALGTSIANDMAMMMILGNKYSKFVTFVINTLFANTTLKFDWKLLPISYYNQKDFIDQSLKLAQSGYSFLLPSIASGVSQGALTQLKELENDVLDLGSVLIPLSSSYTQSGEVGRPEKDPEEKAQKTIQNEDAINNQGGSE